MQETNLLSYVHKQFVTIGDWLVVRMDLPSSFSGRITVIRVLLLRLRICLFATLLHFTFTWVQFYGGGSRRWGRGYVWSRRRRFRFRHITRL